MNGKKARALRAAASTRWAYQKLKHLAHADQGQNPEPLRVRKKRDRDPAKPTWPATPNQRAQSRPIIVVRPVRRLCEGRPDEVKRLLRREAETRPKHELDTAAIRGY